MLAATLEDDKSKHVVVVKSVVRFPFYEDTIEVDGWPLALTKTK
jgi:hypothetical protein